MTNTFEILFVDTAVSDLAALLAGVRPEVEAIVLDAQRPAARQMAEALAGRAGLAAVHVVAHGASGRVSFSAGDWSAGSLAAAAEDFAAIGRALGEHGGLRLWSCHAGAGAAGAALVEELEAATGPRSPRRMAWWVPRRWVGPGRWRVAHNARCGRR